MNKLMRGMTALAMASVMAGCTVAPPPAVAPAPVVETVAKTKPKVLKARTFDQAVALCIKTYKGKRESDCINAAIVSWCEFVPFKPGSKFYDPKIDGRCLAAQSKGRK